jgi:hypothetical protein
MIEAFDQDDVDRIREANRGAVRQVREDLQRLKAVVFLDKLKQHNGERPDREDERGER